jgi:hypothetical protein
MSDFRDVERFLFIDLPPGGIAAICNTIQKTNADSQTLGGVVSGPHQPWHSLLSYQGRLGEERESMAGSG